MSATPQQKQFFKHKAFNLISFGVFNSLIRSGTYNSFLSKRSLSKSFTLIELSVVIVVISIMLSIILASKAFINSSKINKIYEEYRMYNNAITIFYNTYNCMPGDCPITSISDISASISSVCNTTVSSVAALANSTNTEIYNTLGTGLIESTTKRTCMFQQLQVAGFIVGKVNLNYNTGTYPLTDSIAGQTIPSAMFSNKAAWDFRTPYPDGVGSVTNRNTIPYEIAYPGSKITNWAGNNILILRDSNLSAGLAFDSSFSGTSWTSGAQYAVTSNLAGKLDTKFDDGLPYAGNIAGALTASDLAGSSPAVSWMNNNVGGNLTAPSCSNTVVSGLAWGISFVANAMNSSTSYLSSNNVSKGCLVAFLIPNLA